MKTFRPLLLAGAVLLASFTAHATTVVPPTFDELVKEAEVIFEGTVTKVESQFIGQGADRHIVTFVTLAVNDALKGEAAGTYTMRMLGGTVGDETLAVSDAPKFQVGDRDILFVENNGKQFIPLVGIMHGRFHLQQDKQTGADIVLENNGNAVTDLQRLGRSDEHAPAAANAVERPLDAEAFKAAIRSKLPGA